MATTTGRGGRRPGAGRKPTRERFARPIAAAEKRIADQLPSVIDRLMELAEGVWVADAGMDGQTRVYQRPPDFRAASYLVDRILGKPTATVEADVTSGGAPVGVVVYIPENGRDTDEPSGESAGTD